MCFQVNNRVYKLIMFPSYVSKLTITIRKYCSASIKIIKINATRENCSEALKSFIQYIFRFNGEVYQSAGFSAYNHDFTLGMANYHGKALTTGCDYNWNDGYKDCYVKTELMDMNTLAWSSGPDYPFYR